MHRTVMIMLMMNYDDDDDHDDNNDDDEDDDGNDYEDRMRMVVLSGAGRERMGPVRRRGRDPDEANSSPSSYVAFISNRRKY